MDKKPIKEKVKAKAKSVKEKLKGKAKKCAKCVAFLLALSVFAGCMTPGQASRSTHSTYGDIEPDVRVEAVGSNTVAVTVNITFGDGAIASADSSGSTESQTQTPTFDISPKTDLHYNDAVGKGGDAVSEIFSALTPAAQALLKNAIAEKQTGTFTLDKADGGTVQVKCENGQCSLCTDCVDK